MIKATEGENSRKSKKFVHHRTNYYRRETTKRQCSYLARKVDGICVIIQYILTAKQFYSCETPTNAYIHRASKKLQYADKENITGHEIDIRVVVDIH